MKKGNLHTLDMHRALFGLICIFGQNLTLPFYGGWKPNSDNPIIATLQSFFTKELGKKRGD